MSLDLSMLEDVSALFRSQEQGKGIRQVRIDAIRPDPEQPRKIFEQEALDELAASIRSIGIIQPPVVRSAGGGYKLISGERRWRAASQLGWETIDVIVRDDLNARAQLVENIQREALSVWEIYRVIAGEIDAGAKQVDLAAAFGKSKAWVAAYASVAKMPESFMTLLRENRVSGITALQSFYRLYKDKPEVAKQLLGSSELITTVTIAQVSATAATATSRPVQTSETTPQSAHNPEEDGCWGNVTPKPLAEVGSGKDLGRTSPLSNSARMPNARKHLPICIRANYDNANWIVDYTRQRSEVDGTVSVVLEDAEGSVRFAPIAALRLQSIEVFE